MKKLLNICLLLAITYTTQAQVGVGTSTPDASAALEVQSTTRGFLPPRMTLAQIAAIASPAEGLFIYCTNCSTKGIYIYNGSDFTNLPTGTVLDISTSALNLHQIGEEADDPDTVNSVITATALNAITGVSGATGGNETAYQDFIDENPDLFSVPATATEVQNMVTTVNAEAASPGLYLAQIGNEGDDPDTVNSVITVAELAAISGVSSVLTANETAYQNYIDDNPEMFASPATALEVQAMVSAVNAEAASPGVYLTQIGNEGDDPDMVNSVITAAQLAAIPGLTGVDPTDQTDYQDYIDDNPNDFSAPALLAEVQSMIDNVSVPTVTGGAGGIWMDRNLGASQVATSETDADAYGDLYQWGRTSDGHQIRTSSTAAGPVSAGNEMSNFITTSTSNWLDTDDPTRWNGSTKNVMHDPCPTGFRVATRTEWENEFATFSSNNAAGAYASALKLTRAGSRNRSNGNLNSVGVSGSYWTSTSSSNQHARIIAITGSNIFVNAFQRSYGMTVRCIQE